MSAEEMKATVHGAMEAVMKNDVDKLLTFFADDATISGPGFELKGSDGLRRWLKWLYSQLTELTVTETRAIIEGDKYAQEYVLKGTTAEGLSESVDAAAICDFKDGKIRSMKHFYDRLIMAKQLAKGWMAKRAVDSIIKESEKGLH